MELLKQGAAGDEVSGSDDIVMCRPGPPQPLQSCFWSKSESLLFFFPPNCPRTTRVPVPRKRGACALTAVGRIRRSRLGVFCAIQKLLLRALAPALFWGWQVPRRLADDHRCVGLHEPRDAQR